MRRVVRRILFMTDGSSFGGAERYILSMAAAARRRGIHPLICWLKPALSADNPFVGRDADVDTITIEASLPIRQWLSSIGRVLGQWQPDFLVINASGRPRFWLTTWVSRLRNIPVAWVHHMIEGRDHRRLPPRRLGGRVEGLHLWRVPQGMRHLLAGLAADSVVTSNEADGDAAVRWYRASRRRLRVISPGIDPDVFQFDEAARTRLRRAWGIPEGSDEPFLVGTAARLVEGKGVDLLIDAVASLRERGIGVDAVIAGGGPACDALISRAARLGIADNVAFLGRLDDMPAFYSALDVAVLASATESFGLTIAEAMACERPVIATPTAGARRQIEHLRSGWLLNGFDAAGLASAITALREDRALCRSMGAAARAFATGRSGIDGTLRRMLTAVCPERESPEGGRQILRPASGVR